MEENSLPFRNIFISNPWLSLFQAIRTVCECDVCCRVCQYDCVFVCMFCWLMWVMAHSKKFFKWEMTNANETAQTAIKFIIYLKCQAFFVSIFFAQSNERAHTLRSNIVFVNYFVWASMEKCAQTFPYTNAKMTLKQNPNEFICQMDTHSRTAIEQTRVRKKNRLAHHRLKITHRKQKAFCP